MKDMIIKIITFFTASLVGSDEFGNKYYESRRSREFSRKRRWVLYNGISEATKVPPNWFVWLHYQSDVPPAINNKHLFWEKKHIPNLTGTPRAYYPAGHILSSKGVRDKATGDYTSWKPQYKVNR